METMVASRTPVKYAVVDAFTSTPFKGNPGAVCFLDQTDGTPPPPSLWMQSVASEFNISETAFIIPTSSPSRFHLRWFTPVAEVDLCGHGTLAAAHFLFSLGYVRGDLVEFVTRSGILTARKLECGIQGEKPKEMIELDFPVMEVTDCEGSDVPKIPQTLNGAVVVATKKIGSGDLLLELASGKEVVDLKPQIEELRKCAGRGVLITGPAPDGSGFDFYSRFFCPKYGIDEDPVCGSAHCALAPYWKEKLGKCNLIAYMASPRSGILDLFLEEEMKRVRIRGEAVTVMAGSLLGHWPSNN